jgi:hypothetical protein
MQSIAGEKDVEGGALHLHLSSGDIRNKMVHERYRRQECKQVSIDHRHRSSTRHQFFSFLS